MNKWIVVRIFVSSTFKDMDVERDALRNIIVPRLNDCFIGKHVNIQLVDLRHSVETDSNLSQEEREKKVYDICMDEIDACQPFFIGLVGHRYGWIPKEIDSLQKIKLPEDFPLNINQLSVTVCEFFHALYGKNASNRTLVMLRDEKSYTDLTEKEIKNYIDEGKDGENIKLFRDYLLKYKRELSIDEPYYINLKESGSKEIEEWSNYVYERLSLLISQHIGNSESLAEDNFIKAQRNYINRHLIKFAGREHVIEDCIKYLERRQTLYIFEQEHGLGQTALMCKLFSILSEDNRYFCLFNSYESSAEASHYCNVFYYWNLQMLRFLNRDIEYLKTIKENTKSLFEEYCRLCQTIYKERNVKVVVFEENPHMMGEYYNIKQAFTLYVHTIPAEHSTVVEILAPYVLNELIDEDFNVLTNGLRKGILKNLRAKKRALNVKWLTMAVNILSTLNKLDYQDIRSKDGTGDNEGNINYHLCRIINEMPDNYEDLSYFWITRLENVLGKEFVSNYIGVVGLSRGLTVEDVAQITGRNVDWCTYFKHILGNSIIKEDEDGYLMLKDNIVREIVEKWSVEYRMEFYRKIINYIQQLPHTSPTFQRNIFNVAMGYREYSICLSYIAEEKNYHFLWGESEAMMAFAQKALHHEQEYLNMVSEMVSIASLDYDTFHRLNLWCSLVQRHHNYTLYLKTAQFMIDRLEKAQTDGMLNSTTALALAEIYDSSGGAYTELPDGEESWDISNSKQLKLCFEHVNESLEWNARLMTAIYDRYEGFGDIRDRWQYLVETFIPMEANGINYDNNPQFAFYYRLLREVAILTPRFNKENDPGPFAMKAYRIAKSLLNKQIQKPDIEVNTDDLIYEWMFSAWQVYRLSADIKCMSHESIEVFVEGVLEEMGEYAEKYFCCKNYSVICAQLTAEYAMNSCHIDAQHSMALVDRLINLLIINDTPDDALDLPVSQRDITFMAKVGTLNNIVHNVSYGEVSLAWALVARYYIKTNIQEKVHSSFTQMGEEIENVMKLSATQTSNIWDRQLDTNFVLLTAKYVKLKAESLKNFPDKVLALRLIDEYMELFKRSVVHYRYINFDQYDYVMHLREIFKAISNKRRNFSQEELERLIDDGAYESIIQDLCYIENGSKEEFFYLGLAYLRSNMFDDAIRIFQMLLGIKNLPNNFYFSCLINYLFTLLAANRRKDFFHIYMQLGSWERKNSDIKMLYMAYINSLNRYDGRITLPVKYGFKLGIVV